MKNSRSIISFLIILSMFLPFQGIARDYTPFRDVVIESPFERILRGNTDFMSEGGARLFTGDNDELILIGIGRVFLEQDQKDSEQQMRRAGEILARVAILELVGDVEVSTIRKKSEAQESREKETISLSSFFQTTKSSVKEKIKQLPIIGSWRSNNRDIFYIAVGKVVNGKDEGKDAPDIHCNKAVAGIPFISGEEPFVSILRASPVLRKNGGVRGFITKDGRRVLISAASAKYTGSFRKAKRTAQLLALRALLGHREGIELSSVELLTDSEQIRVSKVREQRISLSRFTSIQEEKVTGMVKAMPIVATWKSEDGQSFYLALGRIFDK